MVSSVSCASAVLSHTASLLLNGPVLAVLPVGLGTVEKMGPHAVTLPPGPTGTGSSVTVSCQFHTTCLGRIGGWIFGAQERRTGERPRQWRAPRR